MIKAVLMDCDGVLVDACEWHYISLNKALHEVAGVVIARTEHETIFNGLPTKKKLEMLIKQGRIQAQHFDKVWELKQAYTVKTIEENSTEDSEKIKVHQFIKMQGARIVCVTNSITETATLMLEKTGQLPYMDFIITNEMVKYPKPHGEGYIRAMIKLGVMPEYVLIVEDSEKGIKAAQSTGANVMIVKNPSGVTVESVRAELEKYKGTPNVSN